MSAPPSLAKVSIGIKTFIRDPQLFDTIAAIRATLPEVEIVVADCGHPTEEKRKLYFELEDQGHIVRWLNYDSGFGIMSNAIVDAFRRDYLLKISDDFNLWPASVTQGIERLVGILNQTNADIASGRVNDVPYEFMLEDLGDKVIEHRVTEIKSPWTECDLTVNYSLVKRHVFKKAKWISEKPFPIGGGEHAAFFIRAKRAGFKTVYIPGVNVTTQDKEESEEYKRCRNRALSKERPYFKALGIKEYVMANGRHDYKEAE